MHLAELAYKISHEQLVAFTQRAADMGASAPTDEYLAENADNTFVVVPIVNTAGDDMLVGIIALGPTKLPEHLTADDLLVLIDGARRYERPATLLVFLEVPHDAGDRLTRSAISRDAAKRIRKLGLCYLADEVERVNPDAIEAIAKMRRMAEEL